MKIALVSPVMVPVPPLKYGGIEQIVAALATGLGERGHEVTVFCAGGSQIAGKNIKRVMTSPYPTREHLSENNHWERKQLEIVLAEQAAFDLIHFHYEPIIFRDAATTGNPFAAFRVPLVFTFHNITAIPEHIKYYREEHSLAKYHFVFISRNQQSRLAFLPQAQVIYNGIPVDKFPLATAKNHYLLFLGRITPAKGIIEAIAVARETQVPLIIAAKIDPVDQTFYEQEVKPQIDGQLISYVGEVGFEEKAKYLKQAAALLFPVLWEEPFGLVMVEALACGTPVVAFRRGSVPEIIQDGVNGYIVDDVAAMSRAVGDLGKISPQACRQSAENFSLKRMIDEYEKLFLKIKI